MICETYDFSISIGPWQFINLTERISSIVKGIKRGVVNAFTPNEDCAIITIEYDPRLFDDLKRYIEEYLRIKGIDKLVSVVLGRGITLPIVNGALRLGAWQQIVLVNTSNDEKEVVVYVTAVGEG